MSYPPRVDVGQHRRRQDRWQRLSPWPSVAANRKDETWPLIRLFADRLGLTVQEREIDRTELYLAEEVFLCGSGMQVVPVIAVDRIPVGHGRKGPITAAIQDAYFRVARGPDNAYPEWRTPVYRTPG